MHMATPVPCQCEAKPYDDHHHDWGRTDDSYSSDKCHYEYGCNALEFLYHNIDGQDGNRQHYRLRNKNDRTPQEYYSPGSMELYTVNTGAGRGPAPAGSPSGPGRRTCRRARPPGRTGPQWSCR